MLLYTLGSNDYSELTYDPEDSQALIPQKLENFIGQDITKIAYGFFHTLILVNNMVFSFGKTKDGALGRVDRGKEILKIDGLNDIVDISCGETHSAALGINGDLYAWGRFRNLDYKTMKITQNCLRHEPLKIADNVSKMASCDNSITLQKDNGEVFYYGGLNIYKYALEKESSKKLKLKKIKGASDSTPVFDYIKASGDEFFGVKNNEIFAYGKCIYDYLFKKSAPTLESVKFNSKKFKYIYLEKVDDNNEICKVIAKIKSCNFDRFQSLFLSKKRKLYIKGRMITHKINDTFKTKNYKFLSKIMINVDYIA
ncbi:Regulator of chromosome condensation, partial [Conglomerata obtusa]